MKNKLFLVGSIIILSLAFVRALSQAEDVTSWDCSHCNEDLTCYRKEVPFEEFGVNTRGEIKKVDGGLYFRAYSGLHVTLTDDHLKLIRKLPLDEEKYYIDEYFQKLELVSLWEEWEYDNKWEQNIGNRHFTGKLKFPDGKTRFYWLGAFKTRNN
jgi:hypothetical protein